MDLTPITVIIGNKSFITTKNSLLSSGYFRTMMEIEPESTSFIVNDRSKKVFKHILSYLQDRQYPFPRKYKYELDFYDIDYNEKILYDSQKIFITELNEITNKLYNMRNELSEITDKLNTIQREKEQDNHFVPHKCQLYDKYAYVDGDYKYCIDHICQDDHCRNLSVNGTDYCDDHDC